MQEHGRDVTALRNDQIELKKVIAKLSDMKLKKLKSPMPGVIVELRVEEGQAVTPGQVLLILEAMKMQNEIKAEGEGTVKSIKVAEGDSVPAGGLLIDFA